jgi:hypothetical protein
MNQNDNDSNGGVIAVLLALMKNPATWYFMLLVLVPVFVVIETTDWYQEFRDPKTFWTEKVAQNTELLNDYEADVRECTEQIERLRHPDARDIWIKQKALEDMSQAEAVADYSAYLEASVRVCEGFRLMLPGAAQDLETAKAKLQQIDR